MSMDNLGRLLIILGIGFGLLGGIMLLLSRIPIFSNIGNLPGDIRVQGQNFSCFMPIASMILVSIVLTVALNVLIRLLNR
ncbi:DUF2905 domain-containing protein [Chloroflexota bacterium]